MLVIVVDPDLRARAWTARVLTAAGAVARLAEPHEVIPACEEPTWLVVLDVAAPGWLLPELREAHPRVPVALSGASRSPSHLLRGLRAGCVDWLDKPVDEDAARDALQRARDWLPARLGRDEGDPAASGSEPGPATPAVRPIIAEIAARLRNGTVEVPRLPEVVRRLEALVDDADIEMDELAALLQRDAPMAARVVAMANASVSSRRQTSLDLQEAVARLGISGVVDVVRGLAVNRVFTVQDPMLRELFEEAGDRHVAVAQLARRIAEGLGDPDAGEVHMAALLHNVGELFLLAVLDEMARSDASRILARNEVVALLRDWHPAFGVCVTRSWRLSAVIDAVAQHHHRLAELPADSRARRVGHMVNLAEHLAEAVDGPGIYGEEPPPRPLPEESRDELGVEAEALSAIESGAPEVFEGE